MKNIKNPLQFIELMCSQYNWEYEWLEKFELSICLEGQWSSYHLHFIWEEESNFLYLVCCTDLEAQHPYSTAIMQLLVRANQRLWLGHFDILENNILSFRQTVHLGFIEGMVFDAAIQELVNTALSEFDFYYLTFKEALQQDELTLQDLELLSLEVGGHA